MSLNGCNKIKFEQFLAIIVTNRTYIAVDIYWLTDTIALIVRRIRSQAQLYVNNVCANVCECWLFRVMFDDVTTRGRPESRFNVARHFGQ